jgi:carboxyl-terminal processing protease
MTARKTRHLKMWVTMVLVSAALILGHGFYRDLSANSEETYKGLEAFFRCYRAHPEKLCG